MAAVSGNPAVALRDRAREAMLASGGRGFVRFLPPGGALLATDALCRASGAQAEAIVRALREAGFACEQAGALLLLTPQDALLTAAPETEMTVAWAGEAYAAQALALRWQERPPLPLTPAGRQLILETLRLIWQPRSHVYRGIDALRGRAAVMLRGGDASGLHEAGAYLGAVL
ncbi:MAG: hypothetical protein PUH70_10105 [Clostridiales bacterium]|nr:hypothetical protein [Clostridiales bacterium]MDY5349899.1 hypothetical protein [Candidatus Ventricola sp.]MDY5514627.1 hypothetical protein [Candidatus Ventricola sp.]